ncbi:MAG: hypothetical protein QOH96_3070 [Blastocatellia bacterium]|nr:hypothetical protein [Blastocatellia bacterium]
MVKGERGRGNGRRCGGREERAKREIVCDAGGGRRSQDYFPKDFSSLVGFIFK